MCVWCEIVRLVKKNVIDVVGGVEMNGVKIKLVQKKSSNLLEAFGESCVLKLCKLFIKYLKLLKIMYNNFTNTLIYNHFHILNTSINFHYTFIYTFLQIFVALALILHTPFPPQIFKHPHPHYPPSNFFSFPQISKLPPP